MKGETPSFEVSVSRLLMVEDNPMDQAYLRRSLGELSDGLEIRVASSVGQALELLHELGADVHAMEVSTCAKREHGLTIDYIGQWNERDAPKPYVT